MKQYLKMLGAEELMDHPLTQLNIAEALAPLQVGGDTQGVPATATFAYLTCIDEPQRRACIFASTFDVGNPSLETSRELRILISRRYDHELGGVERV